MGGGTKGHFLLWLLIVYREFKPRYLPLSLSSNSFAATKPLHRKTDDTVAKICTQRVVSINPNVDPKIVLLYKDTQKRYPEGWEAPKLPLQYACQPLLLSPQAPGIFGAVCQAPGEPAGQARNPCGECGWNLVGFLLKSVWVCTMHLVLMY